MNRYASWMRYVLPWLMSLAALIGVGHASQARAEACRAEWPLWQAFGDRFMTLDGRVVDDSVPTQHSTSEGQSYGMFFALVANDRVRFDRLWQWSIDNLFGGDVTARLPAWQWGRRDDGTWGVLDPNAASDADLFFAHALLEADRLWNVPAYRQQARQLLDRVVAEEVVNLPGLGPMLLPGPQGFALDAQVWRLNPSYLLLPQLRLLARHHDGPWDAIARNSLTLLESVSPHRLVADWVAYQAVTADDGVFAVDPVRGDMGSYDAIRVYLWAALAAADDPLAERWFQAVAGMATLTGQRGAPPERVYTTTGLAEGRGPVGFAAALAPYAQRQGNVGLTTLLQQSVTQAFSLPVTDPAQRPRYYDYVLALFAMGWLEGRYRFGTDGTLRTTWKSACRSATTP